jgi:hypothetical protein
MFELNHRIGRRGKKFGARPEMLRKEATKGTILVRHPWLRLLHPAG